MNLTELKDLPRAQNYADMVEDMFKEMGSVEASRIHAGLGICGECGEILMAEVNLDFDNIVEESGDVLFYFQKLLNMHKISLHTLMALEVQVDWRLGQSEGMCYEAANLLDVLKKSWVYGSPLDEKALLENLARFLLFFDSLLRKWGVTFSDAMAANQWKLVTGPKARYPSGKYSDAAALARADKVAG